MDTKGLGLSRLVAGTVEARTICSTLKCSNKFYTFSSPFQEPNLVVKEKRDTNLQILHLRLVWSPHPYFLY